MHPGAQKKKSPANSERRAFLLRGEPRFARGKSSPLSAEIDGDESEEESSKAQKVRERPAAQYESFARRERRGMTQKVLNRHMFSLLRATNAKIIGRFDYKVKSKDRWF